MWNWDFKLTCGEHKMALLQGERKQKASSHNTCTVDCLYYNNTTCKYFHVCNLNLKVLYESNFAYAKGCMHAGGGKGRYLQYLIYHVVTGNCKYMNSRCTVEHCKSVILFHSLLCPIKALPASNRNLGGARE